VYVVVQIENESDFPGIVEVYGLFSWYEDATEYAEHLLKLRKDWERGKDLQISRLNTIPLDYPADWRSSEQAAKCAKRR